MKTILLLGVLLYSPISLISQGVLDLPVAKLIEVPDEEAPNSCYFMKSNNSIIERKFGFIPEKYIVTHEDIENSAFLIPRTISSSGNGFFVKINGEYVFMSAKHCFDDEEEIITLNDDVAYSRDKNYLKNMPGSLEPLGLSTFDIDGEVVWIPSYHGMGTDTLRKRILIGSVKKINIFDVELLIINAANRIDLYYELLRKSKYILKNNPELKPEYIKKIFRLDIPNIDFTECNSIERICARYCLEKILKDSCSCSSVEMLKYKEGLLGRYALKVPKNICDNAPGHSGSPVYWNLDDKQIVAVVVGLSNYCENTGYHYFILEPIYSDDGF